MIYDIKATPAAWRSSASFSGFRERLLADPSFLTKMAIEVGIGICTKATAEYTKRGDAFSKVWQWEKA